MEPEVNEVLEPHDSFFIGSDIYYTYIVDNEFWDLRVRQRTEEEYFSLAEEFADKLRNGTSAVDRAMGSYPRLVSLDMPEATSCTTVAEKHQFSQRAVEAVDVTEHALRRLELKEVESKLPMYLIKRAFRGPGSLRHCGRL